MSGVSAQGWDSLGYAHIRNLVSGRALQQLRLHAERRVASGNWRADSQAPGTPAVGYDRVMDRLMVLLLPTIEDLTSLKLFWTYSYFRSYRRGDVLERHTDRPSCEISVSLNIACEPSEPWPLWIDGRQGPAAVALAAGDAVLYRGIECAHWRDPFQGEKCVQVFLHYVDQSGPFADWKYDRRGDSSSIAQALSPAPLAFCVPAPGRDT